MDWLHVNLRLASSGCPAAASLQEGETLSCLRPGAQAAPLATFEGPVPDDWETVADTPRGTLALCPRRTCAQCPVAGMSRHAIVMGAMVRHGSLDLDLAVRSRDTLGAILDELRGAGLGPQLTRMGQRGQAGYDPVLVDLSRLTPRQVQTLRVAAEQGYFRPGSKVMLDDLTGRLRISKSTVHEHLQKGISILVEEALGPPVAAHATASTGPVRG